MTTFVAQNPGVAGVDRTLNTPTATDKFAAAPGSRYVLIYQVGATPTGAGTFKVVDQTSVEPDGADLDAGWADLVVQDGGMLANATIQSQIPNSNRFRDAQGFINLTHTGTLTDTRLSILGPFPA